MDKRGKNIQSMYELFTRKGHSSSMPDIYKRVCIKPWSMYSHFENEDQVVWCALEKEIESKLESLRNISESFENESCKTSLREKIFYIFEYEFFYYTRLKFWSNISFIQNEELRNKNCGKSRSLENETGKKMQTVFQAGINNGEAIKNYLESTLIYIHESLNVRWHTNLQ